MRHFVFWDKALAPQFSGILYEIGRRLPCQFHCRKLTHPEIFPGWKEPSDVRLTVLSLMRRTTPTRRGSMPVVPA